MDNNRIAAFNKLMDTLEAKGIVHKNGQVTVSELIAKLQYMEDIGFGDYVVWYRDSWSDHKVEEGVWDYSHEMKTVTLA